MEQAWDQRKNAGLTVSQSIAYIIFRHLFSFVPKLSLCYIYWFIFPFLLRSHQIYTLHKKWWWLSWKDPKILSYLKYLRWTYEDNIFTSFSFSLPFLPHYKGSIYSLNCLVSILFSFDVSLYLVLMRFFWSTVSFGKTTKGAFFERKAVMQ